MEQGKRSVKRTVLVRYVFNEAGAGPRVFDVPLQTAQNRAFLDVVKPWELQDAPLPDILLPYEVTGRTPV